MGDPDPRHVSTSYAERRNLQMRMSMRRFTRLTNAHSEKVANHCHALARKNSRVCTGFLGACGNVGAAFGADRSVLSRKADVAPKASDLLTLPLIFVGEPSMTWLHG